MQKIGQRGSEWEERKKRKVACSEREGGGRDGGKGEGGREERV